MIQLKTKTKADSSTQLNGREVVKTLDRIAKFIAEASPSLPVGGAFDLKNIRVVLICAYEVRDYMEKYSPNARATNPQYDTKYAKDLDEFFDNHKEIKKENFFILNAADLKQMYGPTFQMVWESIVNE